MIPAWQWDEMVQRGTDYASVERVREYDERMAAMRDVAGEAERILDALSIAAPDTVLEVGTGTGVFARAAARRCRRVVALDISPVMLDYAAMRAGEEGLDSIEFLEAGFLTYEHNGEPFAAAVSQLALHHLPDAWKLIALDRLAGMLRPGGAFYLTDVVFADAAQRDWPAYFPQLVEAMPSNSRVEMARHIRQESSTFDWMMRALLERDGFAIESVEQERGFLSHYLCRRRG